MYTSRDCTETSKPPLIQLIYKVKSPELEVNSRFYFTFLGYGAETYLHVLETNTETLEVDGLAVGDAVENVSVHQLSLRLTHTAAAVAVVPTLVRAQRPAIAVAAAGVVVGALGTLGLVLILLVTLLSVL